MSTPLKSAVSAVKTVVRNLPTIRKEIVAGATAGISMVAVFETTFPQISMAHLSFFSTLTAVLVGVCTFLSNNKVVDGINEFSNQPIWKAKLKYLVKGRPR